MALLADKQITKMCELPKISITITKETIVDEETITTYEKSFSELTEEALRALILVNDKSKFVSYAPLTKDEILGLKPLIYPFISNQVTSIINDKGEEEQIIPKGLNPFGYDVTFSDEFKIFNENHELNDPKCLNNIPFIIYKGPVCVVPPYSMVRIKTVEHFCLPSKITGIIMGKTIYAHCGNFCLSNRIQPGFSGQLEIDFLNNTPKPTIFYANEGGAEILFFRGG